MGTLIWLGFTAALVLGSVIFASGEKIPAYTPNPYTGQRHRHDWLMYLLFPGWSLWLVVTDAVLSGNW
jgi:hypothetical protein